MSNVKQLEDLIIDGKLEDLNNFIFPEFRRCYICKNELEIKEYIDTNINNELNNIQEILKIWESPYIRLMCCYCKQIILEIKSYYNTYFQWPSDQVIRNIMKECKRPDGIFLAIKVYMKRFEWK